METLIRLIADGMMLPIVLLAAYALLMRVPGAHRYDIYTRVLMSGITSYMLAKFVSAVWQPQELRPFEQLGVQAGAAYLDNPGFPSDHTLFAGFLTLAVWFATRNSKYAVILAVMTVLVAIGRVLAQVHTPLDVMAGLGFAVLGAAWYLPYAKTKLAPRLAKKAKK
ncbi:hypothetical protein B7Z00_04160 [Candidatus Saccharibacteria bacterium 32-50-10]|nr:MAG: hypothetical protein B7Z00_04160 [Candidatus Saccharibacteria bacterium 32-50-10]